MAEPSLFQEGSLQVTRRRIIADGTEYVMRDVTSVQIGNGRLSRVLLGLIVLAGIVGIMAASLSQNLLAYVIPIACFGFAGYMWWRATHTYILLIGTKDGEFPILVSNKRQIVDRAAQSIDAMLLERNRFGS